MTSGGERRRMRINKSADIICDIPKMEARSGKKGSTDENFT